MFEKISRAQFIRDNEGKTVSLVLAGILSEKQMNRVMGAWGKGTHLPPKATNNRYKGVFHKYSKGFYRKGEDKEKSYYFFETGSYVVSTGNIYLIIRPLGEDYQVMGYRRED